MKVFMLGLALLALAACTPTGETINTNLPAENDLRKNLSFSSQDQSICNYSAKQFMFDTTVVKVKVYGNGERPSKLEVIRTASSTASAALPSIHNDAVSDWHAVGNGLNCSMVGCGSGSYSVVVTYSPTINSCPNQVSLELQVPPS